MSCKSDTLYNFASASGAISDLNLALMYDRICTGIRVVFIA
jgi:hypothetical protein